MAKYDAGMNKFKCFNGTLFLLYPFIFFYAAKSETKFGRVERDWGLKCVYCQVKGRTMASNNYVGSSIRKFKTMITPTAFARNNVFVRGTHI